VLGWPTHPNITPLPPRTIIDVVVVENGAVFEMSRTRVRAVIDVFEPVEWFGPIADVTGRCRFGRKVVRSAVYWAGLPQNGRIEPTIVDGAVVGLVPHLDLPVGSRIR
jgi:hypothetical protein